MRFWEKKGKDGVREKEKWRETECMSEMIMRVRERERGLFGLQG